MTPLRKEEIESLLDAGLTLRLAEARDLFAAYEEAEKGPKRDAEISMELLAVAGRLIDVAEAVVANEITEGGPAMLEVWLATTWQEYPLAASYLRTYIQSFGNPLPPSLSTIPAVLEYLKRQEQ